VVLLKRKNLIYIFIGTILLIACIGLIYINLDTEFNPIENSSKVNNTNDTNNTNNINNIENSADNQTNTIYPDKSSKNPNNHERRNKPNNIPKKSRLSYSEALSIAKEGSKDSNAYIESETYIKYKGYVYFQGALYWHFEVYSKKDNKHVNGFHINDATGNWQ
jgi:hypothetical protein